MTNTRTRLLAAVTSHFGTIETPAADPLDAVILRDLKPDSLDLVEVIMALEDEFQIVIEDDEAMTMHAGATLREVLALVDGKLGVAA